jgi:glycosyltransferase involved in cell wall biosynthesis
LAVRYGITPDDLVVGTVGTLRPEKNLRLLVAAVAQVSRARPVKLVIVGDGPERLLVQTEAAERGLGARLILTGRLARPEALLGRFDIFALSSDTEQMPYSIIEAMAASRAIVATDVGDVASMVAAENRPYVVPAQSFAAYCGALAALLEQPRLRLRLGAANREAALARYDVGGMIDTYRDLFAGLTSGGTKRLAAE